MAKKRAVEEVTETVVKRTKRTSKANDVSYAEISEEEIIDEKVKSTPAKKGKGRTAKADGVNGTKQAKSKVKEEPAGEAENVDVEKKKPVKRVKKTKEEKEAELLPLAPRTVGSKIFIGAHVSASGGMSNSIRPATLN